MWKFINICFGCLVLSFSMMSCGEVMDGCEKVPEPIPFDLKIENSDESHINIDKYEGEIGGTYYYIKVDRDGGILSLKVIDSKITEYHGYKKDALGFERNGKREWITVTYADAWRTIYVYEDEIYFEFKPVKEGDAAAQIQFCVMGESIEAPEAFYYQKATIVIIPVSESE
ncbi:MAG: hypothetical protein J1E38_10090 [Paramuribaculum sp.]|nr:hypothetical protein [Paramuribaculum sp.]